MNKGSEGQVMRENVKEQSIDVEIQSHLRKPYHQLNEAEMIRLLTRIEGLEDRESSEYKKYEGATSCPCCSGALCQNPRD